MIDKVDIQFLPLAFGRSSPFNTTFRRVKEMVQSPNYATLVVQAENAVKDLKDPELKRIAFQKVLDDLLAGGDRRESPTPRRSTKAAAKTAKPKSSRGGPSAYIRELIEEAFFKKPKTISDVKVELENRGHHIPLTSLSGPMQSLCKARELRRKRTNEQGAKKTFVYSNW